MKRALALMLVALAACGDEPPRIAADNEIGAVELPQPSGPPVVQQVQPDAAAPSARSAFDWESSASGEGTALRLNNPDGSLRMSIACLARPGRLVASVPSFSPIGSEDRFALALGSEPVTLVADPTRQQARPGVTGQGAIPDNLEDLLRAADEVGALYGTQRVGPHGPPPPGLVAALMTSCAELRE